MGLVAIIFSIIIGTVVCGGVKYEETWESLDARPLPQWYDDGKIGIFVHWGVYSVPSFGSEWFWHRLYSGNQEYVNFMKNNYPPGFTYQGFANDFKATFFDPKAWAELFKKSGAKYIVLTSKHHEGYTLWPSTYSYSWNSKDVGPHRDLVGDLAHAIRNYTDIKFGLYHSLYEWFNPLWMADKQSNLKTDHFVENKLYPELLEMVNKYRPEIVWADGEWLANCDYWRSKKFLAWLYNESPVKDTVVVNDRWGREDLCHHGGFFTCSDRYNPGVLQSRKWENAMTIDKVSWGYRREAKLTDYLTTHELLTTMVQTVSTGGNILINVGPTRDGVITPIYEERLTDLGKWLEINGDAIYGSKPWVHQNDTIGNVWYTAKDSTVYGITFDWPFNNLLQLGRASSLFPNENTIVSLLGNSGELQWSHTGNTVDVRFPDRATVKSEWVWVVKIAKTV